MGLQPALRALARRKILGHKPEPGSPPGKCWRKAKKAGPILNQPNSFRKVATKAAAPCPPIQMPLVS